MSKLNLQTWPYIVLILFVHGFHRKEKNKGYFPSTLIIFPHLSTLSQSQLSNLEGSGDKGKCRVCLWLVAVTVFEGTYEKSHQEGVHLHPTKADQIHSSTQE